MGEETLTLESFLEAWEETDEKNKAAFLHFKSCMEKKEGIVFEFIPRPGVTYSLRLSHPNHVCG